MYSQNYVFQVECLNDSGFFLCLSSLDLGNCQFVCLDNGKFFVLVSSSVVYPEV